ncbi:copper resistance protein CopD [Haloterrigena sp. SYSU A558-1]|uniref:Copper resistance protein CopD n=1 Tax=Haloterrigena gelatinilytica TaxID=2741724 RepID=A0A8J8GL24_9EURY|nr:copper resistance protein CopD [Haloterrigena gelatinilytica]NUB89690.1 copper resistance protein CopD [Haloterrigena gelatinilytica]NUC74479.1 copper resistance protein CopD [Haloterrigena gelatinilytica]
MVDAFLAQTIHLIFAGIWAGSVFYVAFVVLPLARDGAFNTTKPLEAISGKLTTISRVSALVLLLSGGHLAGQRYTSETLFETTNGHLVLGMVILWALLAGLVEIGAKRLETGLNGKKLREPAANALPVYRAGAVVAIGLLVVGGAITSNAAALL